MNIDIDNILIFTSLLFLTNAISGLCNKKYLYAILFLTLSITSVIVHSNDNIYTNTIDKIVIFFILVYGSYIIYKNFNKNIILAIFILLSALFCGYIYIYGFFIKQFVFNEDISISRRFHLLMHFICSISNHCIIFL